MRVTERLQMQMQTVPWSNILFADLWPIVGRVQSVRLQIDQIPMAMPSSELGNFTSEDRNLFSFKMYQIGKFWDFEILRSCEFNIFWDHGVWVRGWMLRYNKDCWPAWWPFLLRSFLFPSGQNLFLSSCSNSGGLVNLEYLLWIIFSFCSLFVAWYEIETVY